MNFQLLKPQEMLFLWILVLSVCTIDGKLVSQLDEDSSNYVHGWNYPNEKYFRGKNLDDLRTRKSDSDIFTFQTEEIPQSRNVVGGDFGPFGRWSFGSSYGVPATSSIYRIKMRRGEFYWTSYMSYYVSTSALQEDLMQFWAFDDANGIIRNIGMDQCLTADIPFVVLLECSLTAPTQKWKRLSDGVVRRDDLAAQDTWGADRMLRLEQVAYTPYQLVDYVQTSVCWVRFANADRPGGDLVSPPIPVTSEDDCLQRCSYATGCVASVYFGATKTCALKKVIKAQVLNMKDAVVGFDFYCSQRADWPAGKYLSADTQFAPRDCPAGKYCPSAGLVNALACPAGYYCPIAGTVTPTPCPPGYFCVEGSSAYSPCPPGRYCAARASDANGLCSAGYFCPGNSTTPTDKPCRSGYYSDAGAGSCSWCGLGAFSPDAYWMGGPLRSQCVCQVGFTGNNCEIQKCADLLPGVSMLSILFNADSMLRQYTKNYLDDGGYTYDVKLYLRNLLSVGLDFDGDGNITRSEVTSALKYRSLWASSMLKMPIWCASTTPGSFCYQSTQSQSDRVAVEQVFSDALRNFLESPKHSFDGSGVALLSYITATYPTPSWTNDKCKRFDSSNAGYSRVSAEWEFQSVPGQALDRVCGYMNGVLSSAFTTSDVLKGTTKTFVDTVAVSDDASQKRLYCVGVDVVLAGGGRSTSFECAVGLFYDGAPVDLLPVLTMNGVVFQYTDTSSAESEFDIFVGNVGSSEDQKKFVVGINYPAISCGRFADKENMRNVGQLMEYGIRAIQTVNSGPPTLTKMTTFAYRIPFLTRVVGEVTTPSGSGVEGVSISFCHVDPATGENELDTNFCPLQTFVMDKRGHFEGEIRVSHPRWTNQAEYFNASAKHAETMEDGTIIVHEFSPAFQTVKTGHTFGFSTVEIVDITTVSVFGSVIFDPNSVGNNRCPFAGVPVMLVDSTGCNTTVYSDDDGSFQFALNRGQTAIVSIPDFNGYTWISNISTLATDSAQTQGSRRELLELIHLASVLPAVEPDLAGTVGSPTVVPTSAPTALPTIHITEGAIVQLIHQYTFNKDPPYGAKAHDDIGNTDARLVNGVQIINGKAKFDYQPGKPVPYIQLPYAVLGGFPAVTIECWADFDAANDIQSTLFSFGANPTSFSMRANFKTKNVYIAVVYNPSGGYSKVYINGAIEQTVSIPNNSKIGGNYNLEAFNFIGRNFSDPKTGLDALVDEFRIWHGELDSKTVQSNYRTGVDPSHVTITRADSRSNVKITFMATSLQPISVGFYGGESRFPMFGSETQVQLTPLDPRCKYTPRLSLSGDTSSVSTTIAAMNYTITMLDSGVPAPIFAASICDPTHPTVVNCFCDKSKAPFQYLRDSGQINQTLIISEVDSNVVSVIYSYHN